MKTNTNFLSYLARLFLGWEMFWTKGVEKNKTHILRSTTFFENRAFYEIMWKNVLESAGHRCQYDAWTTHVGYLSLQTHSYYEILTAFPLQQLLQESASMLSYTYTACLVFFTEEEQNSIL